MSINFSRAAVVGSLTMCVCWCFTFLVGVSRQCYLLKSAQNPMALSLVGLLHSFSDKVPAAVAKAAADQLAAGRKLWPGAPFHGLA